MKPKATEDIIKSLENMTPYKALAHANKYNLPEVAKIFQQKVKPINDKLISDTKKYNKKNLSAFIDFVCTWMDEQGGQSHDIYDTFADIMNRLGNRMEDDFDDGDEEMDEFEHPLPTGSHIEETYYSDNTIKSFKQLLINYVIDELSNTVYVEDEYADGDDGPDGDEGDGMTNIERIERNIEREDREIKEEEERLEKEKKKEEKKRKKKEAKRPINKIKSFLGFNKKEDKK